ncbi:hypothetical protein NECAME_01814 [Necator americanus]|uniref:Uncharacterized protein n=1 Tax=Necator americanus TaxID=51031 RepID=W2TR46_NECAM|nr:hypothetical protein NECAME_01814 [Necator americanus]ETN83507.1 hypothetical protein NECAME_01814 [Necator americanus]
MDEEKTVKSITVGRSFTQTLLLGMRLPKGRSILTVWLLTCSFYVGLYAQSEHEAESLPDDTVKEPFELTDDLSSSLHANSSSEERRPEPEQAKTEPMVDSHSHPVPQSEPQPDPVPMEKATSSLLLTSEAPGSEPEPAIKFDNIQTEDYGDVVELKNQPDDLDTEVIEQLVDRFLNTGSLQDKNAPKFANPAAQALVGSSKYWKTDGLKALIYLEPGSIKDESAIKEWIEGYQVEAQKVLKEVAQAGWKYFSHASQGAKQSLNEAEQVRLHPEVLRSTLGGM